MSQHQQNPLMDLIDEFYERASELAVKSTVTTLKGLPGKCASDRAFDAQMKARRIVATVLKKPWQETQEMAELTVEVALIIRGEL